MEREHLDKRHFDEDGGTAVNPVQDRAGVESEMAFMGKFGEKGVTVVFGEAAFSRDSSEMEQPREHAGTPQSRWEVHSPRQRCTYEDPSS